MRLRIAIVIAIGTLGLVAANAFAATPPIANLPADGSSVVAGSQITFEGTATTTTPQPNVYFFVSKDNAMNPSGRLTNAFAVVTGNPTSNPAVFDGTVGREGLWPDQPGDYYWQVNQDCGSPPAPLDCEAWSNPNHLIIMPRPASSVTPSNPPNTHFTAHPPHKTHKRKLTFSFKSDVAGATFQCLYAQGWSKCSSPHTFRHLKPGRFRFQVKAIVNGVEDPTPASWFFKVLP